jgi:hypothetical protein
LTRGAVPPIYTSFGLQTRPTSTRAIVLGCATLCAWLSSATILPALGSELIRSVGAVPLEIAGRFRQPAGFQQAASGQYFVFDRRGHTVYGIDEQHASVWQIVQIGAESGRIIEPTAFSVAADGTFVVADAPNGRQRIQAFTPVGFRIGGFFLPDRSRPRVILDGLVIGGIGSLQYTGASVVLSLPDSGSLVEEYSMSGALIRQFGVLRPTGHEDDPELHAALNTGLPLRDPDGGYFFVFQAGTPAFRKYDRDGRLVYERMIQGREIDDFVSKLPTNWPRRKTSEGESPFVTPTIRAAAVDASGRLWVSFVSPYTYVFDPDGDKIRIVQFRGAGPVSPNSLSFDRSGRILVTPGLYEFPVLPSRPGAAGG